MTLVGNLVVLALVTADAPPSLASSDSFAAGPSLMAEVARLEASKGQHRSGVGVTALSVVLLPFAVTVLGAALLPQQSPFLEFSFAAGGFLAVSSVVTLAIGLVLLALDGPQLEAIEQRIRVLRVVHFDRHPSWPSDDLR